MIIAKYEFDSTLYDNLLPEFNGGYTGYTVNDVSKTDSQGHIIKTRTIEHADTLPTKMMFGTYNTSSTNRELALLTVISLNTTNITTMEAMFKCCSNLTSLDLSSFNTANVTTMYGMFYKCSSLTSLDLSSFDTSKVVYMSDMFYGCSSLTSLDVSGWDTSKVKALQATFYNCSKITSLDLSEWDISSVNNLQQTFQGCSALTSLDVSKWDTSKVTSLYGTFNNCSKLTTLDVSKWDTKNVTSLQQTFYSCSALTSLDVSKWNTGNVTTLYAAFQACSKLTTLDVSKWDTKNVNTLYTTFYNCSALTSLDVSKWDTGNVTNLQQTFNTCSALTSLDVSKWNTSKVTTLRSTFNNCSALTSLDVSGWDTKNVTTLYATFSTCSKLTSLDLSGWDTSNVDTLYGTFLNCTALTSLDVSEWDTGKVTNLEATFYNCSKLTSLDLSGWDTSNVDTLHQTFRNCSALTSLDVSKWDTGNVTNLVETFYKCPAKYIGVLYCSDDTITKLANAITTQCDFYLDRININSPNPLVNFIEYKECKKEVIYYDSEDNSWKKPVLREWDSIEKHSNGKYYYHKRSGEVVLDGSQQIGRPANPSHTIASLYAIYINDVIAQNGKLINDKLLVGSYSTFFTIGSTEKGIATYNGGARNYIAYNTTYSKTSDIDTVRNELRADPITVVYQLAEEKVYECTDLDLISYADKTNLMVESGAIPHKTTLKIHQNITNITTILQEKVNVLENNANTINSEIETINSEIETVNSNINTMNTEIDNINTDLIGVSENIEGSRLSVDSKDGYLKNVEILGNTIQDANNLADIRSVGDKVENQELYEIPVLSTGKNLFDIDSFNTDSKNTYGYSYLGSASSYTLSIKDKDTSVDIYNLYLGFTNNGVNANEGVMWGVTKGEVTKQNHTETRYKYLSMHPNNKETLEKLAQRFYIQIEEGAQATPYEPYVEDKITILSPTPLEKVGDVADRIICKDGVWGVEKNIVTKVLNGSETWARNANWTSSNYSRFHMSNFDAIDGSILKVISDKFVGVLYSDMDNREYELVTAYNNGSELVIHMSNSKLSAANSQGLKQWLQDNNVTIKYLTAQPQFIPLPYDQQIKLRTFASKTNISFGCEIEPTLKASVPKSIGASVNSHTEQTDNLSKELQKINNLEESVTSEVVSENDLITVENTNNGYFEDVKLEGRTLVNLYPKLDAKNYKTLGVTLSDDTITINADGDWKNFTLNKDVIQLKTSTYYTFVIDIIENTIEGNDPMIHFGDTLKEDPTKFSAAHGFHIKDKKGIYTFKLKTKDSFANTNLDTRDHLVNTATGGTIVFKYMILEGDHTQNSPAFFEGIKSVGQDVDEISVLSQDGMGNMWDGTYEKGSISTEDGTNTTNGVNRKRSFYIPICSEKYYATVTDFVDNESAVYVHCYDKNKTPLKWGNNNITNGFYIPLDANITTINMPTGAKYIRFRTQDNRKLTSSTVVFKCINNFDSNLDYKQDKKRILYYNDETQTWERPILRQWDSIEKHADGKYYYHKRSEEIVLDGSEDWVSRAVANAETTIGFGCPYSYFTDNTGFKIAICDRFVMAATGDHLWHNDKPSFAFNDYLHIRIEKAKLSTQDLAGFKAWLQANNVTVVYQLTEEKVYECTNLDLITYGGETNLMVESGVLNPKVSLKVSNGVGNVVTLLQNKVTMLEQMVYNLMKTINNQQSNIDE